MIEKEKISTKDDIFVKLTENDIEISIKYNKRSTLMSRLNMIKKLQEVLRTI
jgi:arginine repressor